jgi:tetraacyldisaccharide 4'-kinase
MAIHFLSRGYGGRLAGPLQVDPDRHDAGAVGDEPLLLAAQAPAWIARNRVAGARAAVAAGAEVIVMDDGFQNPALHKDWSVLVIDGGYGFGNGRLHPAGPLREPIAEGLARADAMVIIDPDDHPADDLGVVGTLPYVHARLVPEETTAGLRGRRVLAFAGIGRPEKFFATVRALGAELVDQQAFADHHAYRGDEIMALIERAHGQDAIAVTTAKDAVRLPAEARAMVQVIGVELAFEDDDILQAWLTPVLREFGDD